MIENVPSFTPLAEMGPSDIEESTTPALPVGSPSIT